MKLKHLANKSSSLSGSTTSAMAQLLASHKGSFVSLQKGKSVPGKIIKLSSAEILVDVGGKTAALVLEKDRDILHTLLSVFKTGEKVEVMVLSPESETGQPIVSLRRYLGNIAWKRLEKLVESHEVIEAKVSEMARGGYVLTTSFGVTGFLPQSHVSYSGNQSFSFGDVVSVTVLELNRKDNKIIFSQKPTLSDEDFAKLTSKLKPEQKVTVSVVNVAAFGLFVSLPVDGSNNPLEGFIHISEISWEKTAELGHLYAAGAQIEAVVLKIDKESRKVQLSIKRLVKDPFEAVLDKFPIDKQVSGSVLKVEEGGISLELSEGIEGFIRREKVPPTVAFAVGQRITVLISEYDKKRRKIFVVPVMLKKTIGYR